MLFSWEKLILSVHYFSHRCWNINESQNLHKPDLKKKSIIFNSRPIKYITKQNCLTKQWEKIKVVETIIMRIFPLFTIQIKKWFNITLCHSVNKHILELLKRLEFSPNSFIFLVSQDYFKHICGLVW